MSLVFAIEPIGDAWDEWLELAAMHWNETEHYRRNLTMAPDKSRYVHGERIGWFLFFTARDEGRLVGNCGVWISPSMHTKDLIATEDSWFIHPDYRKGWNAIRFYKFGEAEVRKRGAVSFDVNSKIIDGEPSTGRIMEYLGYKRIAVQYSKSLVDSCADVLESRRNSDQSAPRRQRSTPEITA